MSSMLRAFEKGDITQAQAMALFLEKKQIVTFQ